MPKIKKITTREILDSRGNPTVEATVLLDNGVKAKASAPAGASTGAHEAVELRDNDAKRYGGLGVLHAIKNIESKIAPKLIGAGVTKQAEIDDIMIKLDGTKNKSKLGANAILPVSMAVARAGAAVNKIPLYQHISNISGNNLNMPLPSFNIINGGAHAKN